MNSGIDTRWFDSATRPQDDLFVHVNGTWLSDYEIPEDRAVDGAFRTLYDRAEENVRELIQQAAAGGPAPGTDAQRIGDLYASFLDVDAVNAAGIEPIRGELDAIAAAGSAEELATLLGELQRTGIRGIGAYVDTDSKNSSRYLAHIMQSGLGLPDESYYREDAHEQVRQAYLAHIGAMSQIAGVPLDAERIFALEKKIAAGHWDVVARRDAERTYNLFTLDSLVEKAAGFPWRNWLAGFAGPDADIDTAFAEVVVGQPDFVETFARLWASEPIEDWKQWLTWRVLSARSPLLHAGLVDENFAFYGTTLTGAPANRDRWKRGVSMVQEFLGEAVGKVYVEQYFPPESKTRMQELVANLIEAYRRNITDLEWMGPDTRTAALAKLEKFTPKIGYPDRWRDYSAVTIDPTDVVGNYRRGYAADVDHDFGKLGGPVDRGEWFMTPQTVNAYYNPGMNEIVFPAAILQPPFFDPNADDAANYGGIGAVIGHEIGHGFDDQGSKYDGDGNLVDWWTDADRAEFGKRTAALIEQYNALVPAGLAEDNTVNGAFTVGENIGDLGGLSIAIAAYLISLDGKPAPVIDGTTGLQRVFYGWAQVWRTKVRQQEAVRRLATDPHSPPEFRCNAVVRNVDAFYEAFDVTAEDELFLDSESRVHIW
ncbi:M13 family metallopeptidase [Millisia brevis]|uniref:M13 family metallopeptidase n=1 Tax=Millisia brevis TaxID=264148 RepID=UPI00083795EC|nr:M13-type metalloendopeptidase [Millisia brevis]